MSQGVLCDVLALQTCWEAMRPEVGTCLENDAPRPTDGTPGASCAPALHCSPACTPSRFSSLPEFWDDWVLKRKMLLGPSLRDLNITGDMGFGG